MSRYLRQLSLKTREEQARQFELKRTEKFAALLHWINNLTDEQRLQSYRMIEIKELAPRLQENQIAKILVAHGFTKSRKETPQGFIRVWHPPKLSS